MATGEKPILIVDDEEIVRESVTEWLKSDGYNAESAEDGLKALDKLSKKKYDVVVLDMKMPGMDGLTVLKKIHEINPEIKIIIITAYASVETAVQALKDGAVDYIVKPFEPEILEDSVAKWIGKPKITAGSAPTETNQPSKENVRNKKSLDISVLENMKKLLDKGDIENTIKIINSRLGIEEKSAQNKAASPAATPVRAPEPEIDKEAEPLPKVKKEGVPSPDKKEKYCVWMKAGLVSYRLCGNNYKCESCDFAQSLLEQQHAGAASPEMQEVLKRLKNLPGPKRLCRFALKGDVSYRLCSRVYKCDTCSFAQMMEEKEEAALEKLKKRMTKEK